MGKLKKRVLMAAIIGVIGMATFAVHADAYTDCCNNATTAYNAAYASCAYDSDPNWCRALEWTAYQGQLGICWLLY